MTGLLRILLLLIIYAALPASVACAQDATPTPPALDAIRAYFAASRLAPLAGQPVDLNLVVEMPRDAELVEWPPISEDWPPFMVRFAGEVRRQSTPDNREIYSQALVVILWEPGDYQTPETLIGYRIPGYDEVFYAPFAPAHFSVPSVLEADMNQNRLRPLKGQISLFYIPWWGYVLGVGMLSSVGYIVRRWWVARYKRTVQARDAKPPFEFALESLAAAARSDATSQVKCERMTAALRAYLQSRFEIHVEMTTTELIQVLQQLDQLSQERIQELAQLLEQVDLVKFANVNMAEKSAHRLLALASQWIKSVESSIATPAGEDPA